MAPKERALATEGPGSTSQYMSMYGKFSTDGFLRIGNECPDFSCKTTHGHWSSFHEWKKGQWAVLCSHPRAFHPVGTTELGSLSQKHKTLESIGCKVVALSVDSVEDHVEWLKDVEAYHSAEEEPVHVQFPIISDGDRAISEAYSMIDPFTMGQQTLTVRSVFVINPENILMLRFDYPACVGVCAASIFVVNIFPITSKLTFHYCLFFIPSA
uniref:Thioredoxin domain-containing protein n=1 Tax=Amphora coffeiformis TaxID=265554 RepID=A0A7S3PCT5_9STRA